MNQFKRFRDRIRYSTSGIFPTALAYTEEVAREVAIKRSIDRLFLALASRWPSVRPVCSPDERWAVASRDRLPTRLALQEAKTARFRATVGLTRCQEHVAVGPGCRLAVIRFLGAEMGDERNRQSVRLPLPSACHRSRDSHQGNKARKTNVRSSHRLVPYLLSGDTIERRAWGVTAKVTMGCLFM